MNGNASLRVRAAPLGVAGLLCLGGAAWATPLQWSTSVNHVDFSVGDSSSAAGAAGGVVAGERAAEITSGSTGTYDTAEDDVFEAQFTSAPASRSVGKTLDDGGYPPPSPGIYGVAPLPPQDLTIRTAGDAADVSALAITDTGSLDVANLLVSGGFLYVQFSVDGTSVGVQGSPPDVYSEAQASEASGDVFEAVLLFAPPLPVMGSANIQLVDEQALDLATTDDLDALMLNEPFPHYGPVIDTDGDTNPDVPLVYFCLDGSSTLPVGITAADICIPGAGALAVPASDPAVMFPAGLLGLQPGDGIDGLYIDIQPSLNPAYQTGSAVVSLAPGSPTLTSLSASAADLILLSLTGSPGPVVLAPASALGLLPTDNLNALWMTGSSLETGWVDVQLDLFEVD